MGAFKTSTRLSRWVRSEPLRICNRSVRPEKPLQVCSRWVRSEPLQVCSSWMRLEPLNAYKVCGIVYVF